MTNRIIIVATLKLIDNKLAELQKAVKELQEFCLNTEPGMLQYDWYLSESDNTIKVFETYVNSEAVLFHFDNYKSFTPILSEVRTFVSLEIFGDASENLRSRVKKINAPHYASIATLNKLE